MRQVQRSLAIVLPEIVRVDDAFAQQHLTTEEWQLYQRMIPADRKHGVEIAKTLLARYPQSSSHLIRAAVLHDVGKSVIFKGRSQVVARILLHLYAYKKATLSPILGLQTLQQTYRDHAHIGAEMLANCQGCPRVIALIANHHSPAGDAEAEILAEIDALFW